MDQLAKQSEPDRWVVAVSKIELDTPEQGGELLQALPNFTGAVRIVNGQPLLSAREPLGVAPEAGAAEKQAAAEDSARQFQRRCLVSYEVIDSNGELLEAGQLREVNPDGVP